MHRWELPDRVCLGRGVAALRGRVFVMYHPTCPTVDHARREVTAYLKLRSHFESMLMLIWVGQPFPPPENDVRQMYREGFARGPQVESVAWVVDSSRSMGASIYNSLSMQIFPRTTNSRVFREPFEAAGWLSNFDGADADVENILDGLDTLDRAVPESFTYSESRV